MLANKLSGSVLILLLFNRLRDGSRVSVETGEKKLRRLQDKVLIALVVKVQCFCSAPFVRSLACMFFLSLFLAQHWQWQSTGAQLTAVNLLQIALSHTAAT
jgi:hypothetical protein